MFLFMSLFMVFFCADCHNPPLVPQHVSPYGSTKLKTAPWVASSDHIHKIQWCHSSSSPATRTVLLLPTQSPCRKSKEKHHHPTWMLACQSTGEDTCLRTKRQLGPTQTLRFLSTVKDLLFNDSWATHIYVVYIRHAWFNEKNVRQTCRKRTNLITPVRKMMSFFDIDVKMSKKRLWDPDL